MASSKIYVQILLFSVVLSSAVTSERMKSKIYDSIDGVAACFRRLNGTHQFGCGSNRLGNVGIIHLVNDSDSLSWLLEHGEAVPYMVVMKPTLFTRDNLLKLKKSGKINGIALTANGTRPNHFSFEDTCPNRYSGLFLVNKETCDKGSSSGWNPLGNKLIFEDWGFPIFYVTKDIDKIEKCYSLFNSLGRNQKHDRSLCAMEMNSFMFATSNSALCIRRSKMITNFNPMKFCDPLASRNVWSTLFPRHRNSTNEKDSVIVVASRMDASSMFDGITPGAVSPTTGIVALLATAHVLAKIFKEPAEKRPAKNVLFVLFNGESFDYIGSSRMAYDLQKGNFPSEEDDMVADQPPPLKPEDLAYFVELSHLTNQYKKGGNKLVFHPAEKNRVRSKISTASFIDEMKTVGETLGLQFETKSNGQLPPASLQSFIAQEIKVGGVVIADYLDQFTTRYYHSVFDNASSLQYKYYEGIDPPPRSIQRFIAHFSTALARTLYFMLTNVSYVGDSRITARAVDELFHCYVDTVNCSMFRNASYNAKLNDEPANLYVGVNLWRGPNYVITSLTGQTLAYLTGDKVDKSEKECQNNPQQQVLQYIWMQGNKDIDEDGICIQTTMNYTVAVSPAFDELEYDWSSGQYSTWTESVWQELNVRIFLKPSRSHEIKILSIGAIVFSLSFIFIYFVNARSHILFCNSLGTGAC